MSSVFFFFLISNDMSNAFETGNQQNFQQTKQICCIVLATASFYSWIEMEHICWAFDLNSHIFAVNILMWCDFEFWSTNCEFDLNVCSLHWIDIIESVGWIFDFQAFNGRVECICVSIYIDLLPQLMEKSSTVKQINVNCFWIYATTTKTMKHFYTLYTPHRLSNGIDSFRNSLIFYLK